MAVTLIETKNEILNSRDNIVLKDLGKIQNQKNYEHLTTPHEITDVKSL